MYATLSIPGATAFGTVHSLAAPACTTSVYDVQGGEASAGSLDLLLNNGSGFWYQRVTP